MKRGTGKSLLVVVIGLAAVVVFAALQRPALAQGEDRQDSSRPLPIALPEPGVITQDFPEYVPGEIIVSFQSKAGLATANGSASVTIPPAIETLFTQIGVIQIEAPVQVAGMDVDVRSMSAEQAGLYKLTLNPSADLTAAINTLIQSGHVFYAQPNYISRVGDVAATTPNDPYFSGNQWGLNGTYGVRAPQAWDTTRGDSAVKIAIIDTGIDVNHPDLSAKHSGGYDFIWSDSIPDDEHGHGTHVAGIAAAQSNNSYGVAGVSWESPVVSYKVCNASGSCSDWAILQAIYTAADTAGVRVMNLSLGRSGSCPSSYMSAFGYARSKGVTVVAAAGNSATDALFTPASCTDAVAVGSITSTGSLSYFSNYGSWVDVVAPGSSILSTYPGSQLATMSGTSMASPFVTGVVSLIYAAMPDAPANTATVEAVEDTLIASTRDLGAAGRDNTFANGLVDANAAVLNAGDPPEVELPTISGFSPTSGPTGTTVTITGTNLSATTKVQFNNTTANFTVVSSTQVTAVVPNTATTGPITITTPGGPVTSQSSFTVEPGQPTITSFSPQSGTVGTSVTINGTNLSDVSQVTFNGAAATISSATDTRITAVVPAGATTGRITVTTPQGTVTSSSNFTVVAGLPAISTFSPASGGVGTSVTITGANFAGTYRVQFNGRNASFTLVSDTEVVAIVPSLAKTGSITIYTPQGKAVSTQVFTVLAAPKITKFSPTSGAPGTRVTITGSNLTGTTLVAFNGTAAVIESVSASRVIAVVPANATRGKITLATAAGTTVSTGVFTVKLPAPTINSFTPENGKAGTEVIIEGANFTGTTKVQFGNVTASFKVLSDSRIQTWIPKKVTQARITVTTPSGKAISQKAVKVLAEPTISRFSPTTGKPGTSVWVYGSNLDSVNEVTFNGKNAVISKKLANRMLVQVPAGATTGPITLSNDIGSTNSTSNFKVK